MDRSSPTVSEHRRLGGIGAVGILLAVVAFAASGCAGDKQPSKAVASVAATSSSAPAPSSTGNPAAFAQCMRANGLPSFPDPSQNGSSRVAGGGSSAGIDPGSPEFKKASEKCKQYLPTQIVNPPGQDPWPLADKLTYAKCMRASGLPSFPDPDSTGRFPNLARGSALGPDSPQFKQADKACAKNRPQGGLGGAPGGGS